MNIRSKKVVQYLILLICFLSCIAFSAWDFNEEKRLAPSEMECRAESLDGGIKISWHIPPALQGVESVEVELEDDGFIFKKTFPANETSYTFADGVHCYHYYITVAAKNANGETLSTSKTEALFLNYDELPDLPLLKIDTQTGEDPTCEIAEKPAPHLFGKTITNNFPLLCKITFIRDKRIVEIMKGKINVRGNTSAIHSTIGRKAPYKLTFAKSVDLLGRGREYADREWILIRHAHIINSFAATSIAGLCRTTWQPQMMFVNVMLNGDWKGLYVLTESVKRSPARLNVSPTGYIFECDPYYWKPDQKYFQTRLIDKVYGYTLKYPKFKTDDDERITWIRDYMSEFEDLLMNGDERYTEYIDADSFATWILAQDILGNLDGAGGNLFFYKDDWKQLNSHSSKVKAGSLWDFERDFEVADDWSGSRKSLPHFELLFKFDSFNELYKKHFYSVKDKILPKLKGDLQKLYDEQGESLQQSRDLDSSRWKKVYPTLADEIQQKTDWLEKRIQWIDNQLK